MTTDLEKQFFDTFGIEPETEIYWCDNDNKLCECEYDCDELCRSRKTGYPQITDRILLELLVVIDDYYFHADSIKELKKDVLKYCIRWANEMRTEVQALFKE